MKFAAAALSTAAILSSSAVKAAETVDFSGDIFSENGITVGFAEGTECTVEYQELPYEVLCNLKLQVTKDATDDAGEPTTLIEASLEAGAKVTIEDETDLKLVAEWAAEVPSLEWEGLTPEIVMERYPEGDGVVVIDLPDLSNVCVSDVLGSISDDSAAVLNFIAESSGSDVCIGIKAVEKDGTDGVAFQLTANIDFLNEELVTAGLLSSDQFEEARERLGLTEINQEIDVGVQLMTLYNNRGGVVTDSRLRRLEATPAFVDADGKFTMGSKAEGGSNDMLMIGGAGVAGVALVAAGVVMAKKRGSEDRV